MQIFVRTAVTTGVFMAALFASRAADAQQIGISAVSPWWIGGGSYGGGTADGNFLFGMSQVIRAEGDYNVQTATALANFEEARARYIENVNKWTQAYFQMREANQSYQIQMRERNKHSPQALAKAAEVPKLGRDELDPVTGKLHWPDALMSDQFAKYREDIDHLFELRGVSSLRADAASKLRAATEEMSEILRANIDNLTVADFVAARKFLDRLEASVAISLRG
jgi:hypothetical protein